MKPKNFWWEDGLVNKLKYLLENDQVSTDEVVLHVAKIIETEKYGTETTSQQLSDGSYANQVLEIIQNNQQAAGTD